MRLDDIWVLSDLPFIRLYLPMKSISNSDRIYFGISCQKSIPRFLLISVKYLWLSTFPKVADLIGVQSLTASHFLWRVCQTGKCISGPLRATGDPPPAPLPCAVGDELPEPEPGSRVCKHKQGHLCGQENRSGLPAFPCVRSCQEPPPTSRVQWPLGS